MKKITGIISFCFLLLCLIHAQNTGIGTGNPQATLDVNGTFRLGQGAMVNGISADTLLFPGSDSLLPTQLAIKRYFKNGKWIPNAGATDSFYVVTSQSVVLPAFKKVVEKNGMAYVLGNQALWIFDVSDPDTIIQHDSINIPFTFANSVGLDVQGNYVYVTTYGDGKFMVFDVSNPDQIVKRATAPVPYGFRSVVVDGDYAYLPVFNFSTGKILVYNISNPDTLILLHEYTHYNLLGPELIAKTGKWLWVVCPTYTNIQGLSDIFRFKADNPDTLILQNFWLFSGATSSISTSGNRFYAAQSDIDSYILTIQCNQSNNLIQIPAMISIPAPLGISARGQDLYVQVNGNNASQSGYTAVLNFDISDLEPKPKWVYEGFTPAVCALTHFRFLGGFDKLYQLYLQPTQDKRDLIRHADGSLGYQISPWHTDSLFHVTTENGYVGIGTDHPEAKLHVTGEQRIDGHHTIEFGGDIPGKEINAGKIGYETFSPDALDVVGAGPSGNRRFDLFGEDGVDISGKLIVQDSIFHFGRVVAQQGFTFSQHVGIGARPTADQTLLINDGLMMSAHGSIAPGVWLNRPGNVAAEANFIGDRGDQVAGFKTASGWNITQSGSSLHFGIGMDPASDKLSIAGSCKADTVNINNSGLFRNNVRLSGAHFFSLSQYYSSGFGYGTYTPNTLDIVGGGNSLSRTIRLKAEGGTTIDGPVTVHDTLKATSISTETWTDLSALFQNGWVNYGSGFATLAMYKDLKGEVHLRGLIKNGLNQQNTVIVTLPPGYRPVSGYQIYAVPNGVDTAGRVDVETDGDVVFHGVTNSFLSLDQICFKTN